MIWTLKGGLSIISYPKWKAHLIHFTLIATSDERPSGENCGGMQLRIGYGICALVLLLVLMRIIATDRSRPQGFDEPAHVAAGMEWLQFHTYHLDPLHPPVARLAAAGLLYLSGVRFAQTSSTALPQFWEAGNSILYRGNYLRNLSLARFGMLPFFLLLLAVTFLWTRSRFGIFSALLAVALTGTLPVVLAFSSLAYTDLPAACMQFCCILAFAEWLDRPTAAWTAALGVLLGLAVLTKFTSILYAPLAAVAIVLCRFFLRNQAQHEVKGGSQWISKIAVIFTISVFLVWGGYRFSVGPINQLFGITHMPSFQHFPAPVRGLARTVVASDAKLPAPSFLAGLAQVWVMNNSALDAYLFGTIRPGGWWYFFFVELLFKTPIPFLILVALGLRPCYRSILAKDWKSLVPVLAAVTILAYTTTVRIDAGLRHVLVIFPFLAIIAACGASELWNVAPKMQIGKLALIGLLGWQCVIALRPGTDWISYFNELAGNDPSRIIVSGCDLDCGQDVLRLSKELRQRNVDHVSLALWTSADLELMQLPQFDVLDPCRPNAGWVAVSARALREGSVQHKGFPPDELSWLNGYKPVAQIGSTIWLYYLPEVRKSVTPRSSCAGQG